MPSGVVTIGKTQYASGLYWENAQRSRATQTAREALRQPGQIADLFTVRVTEREQTIAQFGLGRSDSGHKSGMPVLSACLVKKNPGSWAGAFRLQEGIAFIAVRDDLIVPDGDQFFVDEAEARDRLLQELSLGGLQTVYAPDSWGIQGADSLPVSIMLSQETTVRLRAGKLGKNQKIALLVTVVGLALVIGVALLIQSEMQRREADRAAQLAALERAQRAAQTSIPLLAKPAPEYPPPERTWEKKPPALSILESCRVALQRMPLTTGSWQLQPFVCDGSSIALSWRRSKDSFDVPPSGALVSDDAQTASMSVVLPDLTARGSEALDKPTVLTRRYLRQNWPGSIVKAPDDPPPPPPPGYEGEWNPPPAPWQKRAFVITVPALPWMVPKLLDGIKGLVINNIRITSIGTTSQWIIEGVIYENRS